MTQPSNAPRRPHNRRQKSAFAVWGRKITWRIATGAVSLFIWLLRLSCRIRVVQGGEYLEDALTRGTASVPCAWHQRLVPSALFMRSLVARGMRVGFLISPSREGDFLSRVARAHGVTPIRGSSSCTGSEAMRALTEAVAERVSPMLYADGPRGPAKVCKAGAVVLASRSGAPVLPIGAAASRYWQVKSWDACHIPKPFCCFTIAVGKPWPVGELEGAQQTQALTDAIGRYLNELDLAAETAQNRANSSA